MIRYRLKSLPWPWINELAASFTTGFQWQWGDAENAVNKWAELAATRLSSWTSGTAAP